jgi:uncharacterized protein YecE (DUF72 family)
MDLYVGTCGYSYKEWKGTFYPEKLPARRMLGFYGGCFRSVEINSTFYGMPAASVLEGWADAVPAGFKFVLKAPKQITHLRVLRDAGGLLAQFVEVAGALTEHGGSPGQVTRSGASALAAAPEAERRAYADDSACGRNKM